MLRETAFYHSLLRDAAAKDGGPCGQEAGGGSHMASGGGDVSGAGGGAGGDSFPGDCAMSAGE